MRPRVFRLAQTSAILVLVVAMSLFAETSALRAQPSPGIALMALGGPVIGQTPKRPAAHAPTRYAARFCAVTPVKDAHGVMWTVTKSQNSDPPGWKLTYEAAGKPPIQIIFPSPATVEVVQISAASTFHNCK